MAQLELPKLGVLCSPNACYFQLLLFGSTVWFVWLLRLMRLGDGNGGVWDKFGLVSGMERAFGKQQ